MLENTPLTPQVTSESNEPRRLWPTPQDAEYSTQKENVTTKPEEPSWEFTISREIESGNITSITAESPDKCLWEPLATSQKTPTTVYQKRTRPASRTHQEVQWRKFYVETIEFHRDNNLYVTLIHHPNATHYEETAKLYKQSDPDVVSETITAARLIEELIKSKQTGAVKRRPCKWASTPSRWSSTNTNITTYEQRIIPPDSPYERVKSCSDLTFRRIDGDGAHKTIDTFLRGGHTPAVSHNLGDTGGKWKAGFGAFYTPSHSSEELLIAVLTIENHQNRAYFEKHNSVLITRIACHPCRPKNCSTWMIARARDYAADLGYNQIGSTAGVNFNQGTVYKAAGFELNTDLTGWRNGDGWTNRNGRECVNEGNKWYKRKYEYQL